MSEIFLKRKEREEDACRLIGQVLNYCGYYVYWVAKDREKMLPNLRGLQYLEPVMQADILYVYAPDGRCMHKRKKVGFYIEVKVADKNLNYVRLSLGNLYVAHHLPLVFVVVRGDEILGAKDIDLDKVTVIWAYRYDDRPMNKFLVKWASEHFPNAKVMYLEVLAEYPFSPYAVVDLSAFRPLTEILR